MLLNPPCTLKIPKKFRQSFYVFTVLEGYSMQFPTVTLIHISPDPQDQSEEAIRLRQRLERVCSITPKLKIFVKVIDYSVLINDSDVDYIKKCLENSVGIWWFGCMISKEETRSLWNCIHKYLNLFGLKIPVYDSPQDVEESFNLACYYPKLTEKIPQAETQLIPLSKDEIFLNSAKLSSLLQKKLGDVSTEGVFFRTFYGTQKYSPRLNMAFSEKELVEGCTSMIEALRKHQDVEGIALREMLNISVIFDDLLGEKWRQEYRVFILCGEPYLWQWNGNQQYLRRQIERGDLDALTPEDSTFSEMKKYSKEIGKKLHARLIVADFAILENGQLILIEINPGYCAGWAHESVYIVYSHLLATISGQSCILLENLRKLDIIDMCGKDSVWGFM